MAWDSTNNYNATLALALGYAPEVTTSTTSKPTTAQAEVMGRNSSALIRNLLRKCGFGPLTVTADTDADITLRDVEAYLTSWSVLQAKHGVLNGDLADDATDLRAKAIGDGDVESDAFKGSILGCLCSMSAGDLEDAGVTAGGPDRTKALFAHWSDSASRSSSFTTGTATAPTDWQK